MSVEILTVSLADETIEKLAQRIVQMTGGSNQWPANTVNGSSQSVTPPEQNTHRTQTGQVSQPPADDWSETPPPPSPPSEPGAKHCQHGEMRYVAAGFSRATNKPYPAFWGCPAPRGQQQCKGVPA